MLSFFKKPDPLKEFSANFDSENVSPFLERIAPHIEAGFGAPERTKVLDLLASLQLDDEKELSFPIRYAGAKSTLKIGIFLDDIDAPDIYFFAPAALSDAIEAEMIKFCEELGI